MEEDGFSDIRESLVVSKIQSTNKLIEEDEIDKLEEKREEIKTNLFHIYKHLNKPIDWILTILAIIGSIAAGLSNPMMAFLSSSVYSDLGNTSESTVDEEMIRKVKRTFDYQVRNQLMWGGLTFVFYFTSICFWSLVGNRCVYNLKKKYFSLILAQEQAWFDINNPFEISSNVHLQLEDIEQGIGDKVGIILTLISQCIIGFILSFTSSWKLTLVMICLLPFFIFLPNYFFVLMKNNYILSAKACGQAGGILEEILYNIKTVASFANFDYELDKFKEKIEGIWEIDLKAAFNFGCAIFCVTFFLNLCIVVGFIYGRTLIKDDALKGGEIYAAIFCTLIGVTGIGSISNNFQMVQEACISFAEYYK